MLRGFSMGGAGTWHLGLHRPDNWCVIGPGAGFTTTKGYVSKFPEPLTPTQETTLHLYDAVDYAENVFNLPVVAYDGAEDKQLQASRNIEAALKKSELSMPFTLLVAPGLKHQFPAEWQKKAEEEYRKHLTKGRPDYPEQLHFVTYTLKYPQPSYWIEILGLDKHYERTVVDAKYTQEGYEVKTRNVRALQLVLPKGAVRSADADRGHRRPELGRETVGGRSRFRDLPGETRRPLERDFARTLHHRSATQYPENAEHSRPHRRRLHEQLPRRARHRPSPGTRRRRNTPTPTLSASRPNGRSTCAATCS